MNLKTILKKIFSSTRKQKEQVIVRIAPSPTGFFHIGTARTALFNYLFVQKHKGKFVLRIEDTDKERSKKEYEESILNGLKWLGMSFDEFYRQSEREHIYKKYLIELIQKDLAYVSKEEPQEEGQRSEVIRFRNPNKKIKFQDLIRGEIEFDTTELGDFVIAKSIDEPVFHLAVVVDDHEMGITHIIRGEDHISNTPRHILIQEAIGAKRPIYAHMPLILNKDRAKMSKRDGATSVFDFKDAGYLPEAFVNFLAFLGWAPKDNREILSLDELINEFEIERIQKGGAIFNLEKLDWFNKEYIKRISDIDFLEIIKKETNLDTDVLLRAISQIKERLTKLSNIKEMFEVGGEFDYLSSLPNYESSKLNWKSNDNNTTKIFLEKVLSLIGTIENKDFTEENIKNKIFEYANEKGRGDVLWPTRYALSGKEKSIDPFNLIFILGKEETIKRLENAINKLD